MSKKLSIIIPVYNECRNLETMIPILMKVLKKEKINSEVIIINDGSRDRTRELVQNFSAKYKNIHLINHRMNFGLTIALKSGFNKVSGDLVVFLPGDYECHPEEDLPLLMRKMDEGYDMVIGHRINRKGLKKITSKIYNGLINLLFGTRLRDANWIKIFKKDVMESFKMRSDWHRYMPIFAVMNGYKVGEIPVKYHPRKFGRSKFGLKRLLIGVLDLLVIRFLFSFQKKPMLVFGGLGFVSFILGIIGGIYLYWIHLVSGIGHRPLIFLVMLLIILGIQLFALGFLVELMVNLIEK